MKKIVSILVITAFAAISAFAQMNSGSMMGDKNQQGGMMMDSSQNHQMMGKDMMGHDMMHHMSGTMQQMNEMMPGFGLRDTKAVTMLAGVALKRLYGYE